MDCSVKFLLFSVQGACSAIAVLLHYWFLAAFMWMLMEGVVLYVALVRVFVKKQRFYIAGFTIVSYGRCSETVSVVIAFCVLGGVDSYLIACKING
jgi:hypothetical protein